MSDVKIGLWLCAVAAAMLLWPVWLYLIFFISEIRHNLLTGFDGLLMVLALFVLPVVFLADRTAITAYVRNRR